MIVGFVQFAPVFGRKKENLSKIETLVSNIEADLLVLPELFSTGYLFRSKDEIEKLAEEIPGGESCEILMKISKNKKISFVAGILEVSGGKFYNSSVFISRAQVIKVYRKAHLFEREKLWFKKGNTSFDVCELDGVKIGMLICFDWAFPEAMRVLALKGAMVICHPSNLVLPYCQKAMVTRAIENKVFIITANRTGLERGRKFSGMSQIVNPKGEIILKAGRDEQIVKTIRIKPELAKDKSLTERNDLFEDRRIDLYGEILKNCNR